MDHEVHVNVHEFHCTLFFSFAKAWRMSESVRKMPDGQAEPEMDRSEILSYPVLTLIES